MKRMGIFKRIKNIVAAETNGFLDQVEKPVRMLNHYVREAEDELAKGQQALANQIFLEKKQAALILQTREVLATRTRQAKLAVEHGDEQIAKLALQEKLIQEEKLQQYEAQLAKIKAQTADLIDKLDQFQEKVEELKHRRLLLLSKLNVTQSLKQINDSFVSFNTDQFTKGFAQVEERILLLESEVEARQQLVSSARSTTPYYVDSSLQEQVEKELQQLKGTNSQVAE
jgi:phage shock protein A